VTIFTLGVSLLFPSAFGFFIQLGLMRASVFRVGLGASGAIGLRLGMEKYFHCGCSWNRCRRSWRGARRVREMSLSLSGKTSLTRAEEALKKRAAWSGSLEINWDSEAGCNSRVVTSSIF